MARCRRCDQEIEWALTHANGKRIPLDPGLNRAGNLLAVERTAQGQIVVKVIEPDSDPAARMAHFATCPNRKTKGKR